MDWNPSVHPRHVKANRRDFMDLLKLLDMIFLPLPAKSDGIEPLHSLLTTQEYILT